MRRIQAILLTDDWLWSRLCDAVNGGWVRFRKLSLQHFRTNEHHRIEVNRCRGNLLLSFEWEFRDLFFWTGKDDDGFILFLRKRWAFINIKCMRKLHSKLQENRWKKNWASILINSPTMDMRSRILCTTKRSVWNTEIISKFKDDFTSGWSARAWCAHRERVYHLGSSPRMRKIEFRWQRIGEK